MYSNTQKGNGASNMTKGNREAAEYFKNKAKEEKKRAMTLAKKTMRVTQRKVVVEAICRNLGTEGDSVTLTQGWDPAVCFKENVLKALKRSGELRSYSFNGVQLTLTVNREAVRQKHLTTYAAYHGVAATAFIDSQVDDGTASTQHTSAHKTGRRKGKKRTMSLAMFLTTYDGDTDDPRALHSPESAATLARSPSS